MPQSLEFRTPDGIVSCTVRRAFNAGYTGRDQSVVRAHVEELAELGVAPPGVVPTVFSVPTTMNLQADEIEVAHAETSGEIEWALLHRGEGLSPLLTIASDHSDRRLEAHDVAASKQITPNVLAREAFVLDELGDAVDDCVMRASVSVDGVDFSVQQEGTVAELIAPTEWLRRLEDLGRLAPDTLVMGGTLPMKQPDAQFAPWWRVELEAPSGAVISHTYRVTQMPPSIV